MDEQPFLQAIGARPEDDGPRLRFADWLDERDDHELSARAEFIRVQCALASAPPAEVLGPLRDRERALLTEHWRGWLKPACQALAEPSPLAGDRYSVRWYEVDGHQQHVVNQGWVGGRDIPYFHSAQFRRGFLSHVALVHKSFRSATHVARLCDRAPLDGLTLMQYPSKDIGLTLGAIDADRLRYLELGFTPGQSVAFVAGYPPLAGLEELVLRNVGGEADIGDMLGRSVSLHGLKRLSLYHCRLDSDGLSVLCRAAFVEKLERLELIGCGLNNTAADVLSREWLATGITHLRLSYDLLTGRAAQILRRRFGDVVEFGAAERDWPARYYG